MGRSGPQWLSSAALLTIVFAALAAAIGSAPAQQPATGDTDLAQRATKARELTHLYRERLKVGIQQAIKESGVVGAIGACNTLAPELNATLTDGTTFELARTALRVRNPENTPDAWEQPVLEQLQKTIENGADAKTLETFDVVTTTEGQRQFRYMQPIMMGELCLACHGTNVAPDVKAEIAKYYSDDKATGYSIGEMRGAFSLVQQMD